MTDLATLQQTLGVSFNHPSLLEQALVHSSYFNENPSIAPADNERLEFLGDAILGFIVAEELYKRFPQFSEGELTKLRSSLVRRDALARMARAIKLGNYLYLGKGEEASGGRRKPANLAGALEAVIAAILLDRGLSAARDFILKSADKELNKVLSRGVKADDKSRLQEIIQARQQKTPAYRVIEAMGPAHDRRFTVEVRVDDTVLGRGSGKSKKSAEAEAARSALDQLSANFTP
ncbi:MAG: ribonuclease III [Dehalococcoidales bacterium]|nr:ribonuclease III [Dehalococcoidales bacterium]